MKGVVSVLELGLLSSLLLRCRENTPWLERLCAGSTMTDASPANGEEKDPDIELFVKVGERLKHLQSLLLTVPNSVAAWLRLTAPRSLCKHSHFCATAAPGNRSRA